MVLGLLKKQVVIQMFRQTQNQYLFLDTYYALVVSCIVQPQTGPIYLLTQFLGYVWLDWAPRVYSSNQVGIVLKYSGHAM